MERLEQSGELIRCDPDSRITDQEHNFITVRILTPIGLDPNVSALDAPAIWH
jgi:hypothetical protein